MNEERLEELVATKAPPETPAALHIWERFHDGGTPGDELVIGFRNVVVAHVLVVRRQGREEVAPLDRLTGEELAPLVAGDSWHVDPDNERPDRQAWAEYVVHCYGKEMT